MRIMVASSESMKGVSTGDCAIHRTSIVNGQITILKQLNDNNKRLYDVQVYQRKMNDDQDVPTPPKDIEPESPPTISIPMPGSSRDININLDSTGKIIISVGVIILCGTIIVLKYIGVI